MEDQQLLSNRIFKLGKLDGIVYDFPLVGDILPRHNHAENDIHITIVARGKVIARGDGWENTYSAGTMLDWEVGQYHEFEALEPNSRLINVIKG